VNFFEKQEEALRRSWIQSLVFFAGTLSLGIWLYVIMCLFRLGINHLNIKGLKLKYLDLDLFLSCLGWTALVVVSLAIWNIVALLGPGERVAERLGGKRLSHDSTQLSQDRALNIVEEMAIASGSPVPDVYVIDDLSINAFAAGSDPNNAVIGLTRGSMEFLSRDELQGVVAHEFSHIVHRDIRLNATLLGAILGLECLVSVGNCLLSVNRSNKDRLGPEVVIGAVIRIIGFIGVFFGSMMRSLINQQREFLADASAIQYTRNPDGLKGAFLKIGGLQIPPSYRTIHSGAVEASHLFFGSIDPIRSGRHLNSHPDLKTRIQRIDPFFDGRFPTAKDLNLDPELLKQAFSQTMITFTDMLNQGLSKKKLSDQKDKMISEEQKQAPVRIARERLNSIPQTLRDSSREAMGAFAISCALLMHQQSEQVQIRQLEFTRQSSIPNLQDQVKEALSKVRELDPKALFPLAEISVPALKKLLLHQYKDFQKITRALVEADTEVDLFEFCLERMWNKVLEIHFDPDTFFKRRFEHYSINPVLPHAALLLSALAHSGSDDPEQVRQAFDAGLQSLKRKRPGLEIQLLPIHNCHVGALEQAMDEFSRTSQAVNQELIDAALQVISFDGEFAGMEIELYRVFSYCLGKPIPLGSAFQKSDASGVKAMRI
jgi:Zn-dependent protease with chaperone function